MEGDAATGTRPLPKGKGASCSKMVSKSNMAKHRKLCGKKKPPKTRKVINRESYARHKVKILNKRFEQRTFDRFRRLEGTADKKRIADFECKGPCTTLEEFTESEKKRRDCASSSAE
ncbi:hypothetical protein PR001_g3743 [Phytophthora rubi]|uniref:Uncharacterized protein n=2 Tax=Phytophthora rubi TaxID=129364 RepID=A0A6A3P4W5_9STRA|nr:hypothetical protein PR001_g3743 [Phytophthora rubi]